MAGELYVQGERLNRRFFYAAPPPLASLRPTDIVTFDYNGLSVATRVVGYTNMPIAAAIDPLLQGAPDLTGAPQALANAGMGQAGFELGQRMVQNQQQSTQLGLEMQSGGSVGAMHSAHLPKSLANNLTNMALNYGTAASAPMPLMGQVPVGQLMMQAGQQAAYSRTRLKEDVAALERYNKDVNENNERVVSTLETALGKEIGPSRAAWTKWWNGLTGASTAAAPVTREPDSAGGQAATVAEPRAMLPAVGAETPFLTQSGFRPIEAIRAGDLILTRDVSTGALAFTPVLTIHHAGSQLVKKLDIGPFSVVTTDLERFWVAGKGWVRVLDLKPGDNLRALSNILPVAGIEDVGTRAVFQVQVAAGRGIVVGESGILAHDERVFAPTPAPFDAATIDGPQRPTH